MTGRHSLLSWLISVIVVAMGAALPRASADDGLFPFVMSYESPPNVTNLSDWLPRPAGKQGFVRAQDEHFVTDDGQIRFWGTNLCFDACFPSHDQAERLAARLARWGTNCVRMHHMDARSIWGNSPDKLTIDPQRLDRLDYLIYQLKLHGVYTNINLHVSRSFGEREGFVALEQRPRYDKGLDNFEPRMIELQRKYARDLLTHVNPYTKRDYAHEPAVAMVEISNEDALFTVWSRGQLDGLPDPYATTFRKLWNDWLRDKYGDTESLRKAWDVGTFPLGNELLKNGDFASSVAESWHLEIDDQTEATLRLEDNAGREGRCLKLDVKRQGRESWRPQLTQAGFTVKRDTPYTFEFLLRTDSPRQIGVNCMMAHDPWQRLGLSVDADGRPEWELHRYTFLADKDDSNARITFTGLKPGTYFLADVSLRPGGIVGLEPGQRLEDSSVPTFRRGDLQWSKPAQQDFIDFMWDTERDYWWGMYEFLKKELDVQSLVSGTQLSYSPVHVQAKLDYIDAHSYWQHPVFPNRSWDSRDWYIRNVALVNTPGGTLASLAGRRVAGLPYTISEYNHPAPNSYEAEGFPMLAAFGAFQAWDGLFPFAYAHNTDLTPRQISSYFNVLSHTTKLAHMPACVALFVRGDVSAARHTLRVPLDRQAERKQLHATRDPWSLNADRFGVSSSDAIRHRLTLNIQDGASPTPSSQEVATNEKVIVSDTEQLRWDVSQADAGFFVVDAPRTKLFTGFVRRREFDLGEIRLKIGPTRSDWATVSLVCVDGPSFDQPGRVLVAATGWAQNTDAQLEDLGQNRVTLSNRWGRAPVLCEGVNARISLPVAGGKVRLYPLDENGDRRPAIPVTEEDGKAILKLSDQHQTVWYEVEIVGG